jgi:hypothetical protein
MAIEKGLYGMPEGLDGELMGMESMGEPDVVMDIGILADENLPIMVELEDGGVEGP